jgi:peroxiredoxin
MTPGRRIALFWGVGAAAALGGAGLALWRLRPTAPAEQAVAQLFALSLPDPDGREQHLGQWQGKVLVVNFWATWCPPCVEEMPDLQRIRNEYVARGVEVVGIGIDSPDKIRRFRDQQGLTLPLLVAGFSGSELAQSLGNQVAAMPYTVVIDRGGRVAQRKLGRIQDAELRQWLDRLV